MKICIKCKIEKPADLDHFYKRRKGLASDCKMCHKQYCKSASSRNKTVPVVIELPPQGPELSRNEKRKRRMRLSHQQADLEETKCRPCVSKPHRSNSLSTCKGCETYQQLLQIGIELNQLSSNIWHEK